MKDHVCASCKLICVKVIDKRAGNRLVLRCANKKAPIWLLTGGKCKNYESKISQIKEVQG